MVVCFELNGRTGLVLGPHDLYPFHNSCIIVDGYILQIILINAGYSLIWFIYIII